MYFKQHSLGHWAKSELEDQMLLFRSADSWISNNFKVFLMVSWFKHKATLLCINTVKWKVV